MSCLCLASFRFSSPLSSRWARLPCLGLGRHGISQRASVALVTRAMVLERRPSGSNAAGQGPRSFLLSGRVQIDDIIPPCQHTPGNTPPKPTGRGRPLSLCFASVPLASVSSPRCLLLYTHLRPPRFVALSVHTQSQGGWHIHTQPRPVPVLFLSFSQSIALYNMQSPFPSPYRRSDVRDAAVRERKGGLGLGHGGLWMGLEKSEDQREGWMRGCVCVWVDGCG